MITSVNKEEQEEIEHLKAKRKKALEKVEKSKAKVCYHIDTVVSNNSCEYPALTLLKNETWRNEQKR